MYAIRSYYVISYNHNRGIKKTSLHLFRHTFAKKYLLAGGDIFRLQQLMGHSNINITKEYLNLDIKDLQQNYRITSYNVCYTKLLRIQDCYIQPPTYPLQSRRARRANQADPGWRPRCPPAPAAGRRGRGSCPRTFV